MSVIKPTVGRKVWYRPSLNDVRGPLPMRIIGSVREPERSQPLDATIIAVWDDRMVNLLVTDCDGRQFPVLSCQLLQEDDEPPRDADGLIAGRYCEWMPYQLQQSRAATFNSEEILSAYGFGGTT